jgi:hypothetical protein
MKTGATRNRRSASEMEIQQADKKLRLLIGLVFLVAVVAAGLGLWGFEVWLDGVKQMPLDQALRLLLSALVWIVGSTFFALLLLGLHLWRWGKRIRAAGQFPLPGSRVVRDTVVLHGEAALRRGRILQATAAALISCGLALLAAFGYFYWSFFSKVG